MRMVAALLLSAGLLTGCYPTPCKTPALPCTSSDGHGHTTPPSCVIPGGC